MTAPMTQATFVASAVTAATARGVTDSEALRRLRQDAADYWASYLNTFSGAPRGSTSTSS